ncbi:cytochrome c oxidase assembly protein [Leekyejoonella antrihumi]|uniref:Cytochrome C oxidase assembly protein n=1 Tax=Leekyejoonella antrihumi TaxID=1660198 RepID=A0A563E804_9MICO|nr:cytochrome c oxidase assembly protein [Leekyejoonella antrihumi]TWP37954.1 cytochrome C oxidase assembly protein [Leekyejoonella antrihumi]
MTDVARPERTRPRASLTDPRGPAAAVVAGLLLCLLAVTFGGAATKLELLDPGGLVRWGLPLVRVVNDVALALTVGALMLGGLLMPEAAKTRRRARAARYAGWSALTWAAAGTLGVVFGYADVSGRQIGSAGFWTACWHLTWQLETLRAAAITVLIALVIALFCFAQPGRNGQAGLFFLGLLALVPLALVGHSAGSADHDTAVNSLLVHLLGVTIWVGGLLGLLVLWRGLGKGAASTVARFSRIATWCYVAVGVSGVLNAAVRLGGWDGLQTRYGVLVLAKGACLGLLGVFGYLQRERVVARLRTDPKAAGSKRLFVRLAGVEGLVMGATIGIAAALARSAPPVPDAPTRAVDIATSLTGYPAPARLVGSDWYTAWRTDWLFTAVALVGIGVYCAWVLRLRRRGDRWPWMRLASWCAGWVVFLYLTNGAPAIYGRVQFSVHMLEHMAVSMLVPILLVRGGVVTLALRALPRRKDETLGPRELILAVTHSRAMNVMANPAVAAALMLGTLILFYYSPFFELALRTHTGHLLMMAHFMLMGYIYAWSLVGIDPGPKRWPAPLRLGILLITITFHAFFGVALMTGTTLLGADFFTTLHFVDSAITDQQRGGTVAWGSGELPTLLLALLIAVEWMRKDEVDAGRYERQAQRDEDAELKAYNQYLAQRSQGRTGPTKE